MAKTFRADLEQILAPTLGSGDIVIKVAGVREAVLRQIQGVHSQGGGPQPQRSLDCDRMMPRPFRPTRMRKLLR
jgi:hypothetical protein